MTPVPPKKPKAEANRLSTLLATAYGADRFPVNVEKLARDYGDQFGHEDIITQIIGKNLPGFEGALYGVDQQKHREWVIVYNSSVKVPGRIRFTLAHELGHYILHRQGKKKFECSQDDMLRWESLENRIEVEADLFASYLLMPIDDFQKQIGRDVVDLELLDVCASRYGVSLTAAVLKWLEFTSQRAVLVISRDGYILWARSSDSALKSGAFFRTRGQVVPIPNGSLAANEETLVAERQGIDVPAHIWFSKEPKEMPVREMKIVSDRFDQTMTLLILPNSEPRYFDRRSDSDDPDNSDGSDGLDSYIKSGHFPKR